MVSALQPNSHPLIIQFHSTSKSAIYIIPNTPTMKTQSDLRKAFTIDTIDVFTEFTHSKISTPILNSDGYTIGTVSHKRKDYYQAVIVPLGRLYVEETGYHRSRYQAIKEARRIVRRCYLTSGKEYQKGLDINPVDIEA